MKKLSLLLCALMITGVTFAGDGGGKDKKCCKKSEKKECCKKGDKKHCDKKEAKAEGKKAS